MNEFKSNGFPTDFKIPIVPFVLDPFSSVRKTLKLYSFDSLTSVDLGLSSYINSGHTVVSGTGWTMFIFFFIKYLSSITYECLFVLRYLGNLSLVLFSHPSYGRAKGYMSRGFD